jgi:hypothetical protein
MHDSIHLLAPRCERLAIAEIAALRMLLWQRDVEANHVVATIR